MSQLFIVAEIIQQISFEYHLRNINLKKTIRDYFRNGGAKGAITTHNLVLEYVGNIMKIHKKQQQLSKILTIKTEKII